MTSQAATATARPPIHMIDTEADALTNLALGVADRLPELSEMLLEEIARATLHEAADLPPDVVSMNATVRFADEANGREHHYRLVYPGDADISAGRLSILTPIGAGLIGLSRGQSILWPDRTGKTRRLEILGVEQA